MRLWPSLLALLLPAAPAAAGAVDGPPPAGETAVTAAARSCVGLTDDLEADRHMLEGRGWTKANDDPNAKPAKNGDNSESYRRDGMILKLGTGKKPNCMVIGKATVSKARLEALAIAALGDPIPGEGAGLMWMLKGRQTADLYGVPEADHRVFTFFFSSIGQKN